jgi:hypothetical protein
MKQEYLRSKDLPGSGVFFTPTRSIANSLTLIPVEKLA